ncbi:hypothetical protein DAPPUDRAFT_274441 [Daphnia pulex]|uniref:Uncharacterized protein n=1 Tax=Daphnia pulex TaxID=6669 RepID=E9I490_DAPPU|nr:hypothetical protein DAPPUDRAFT_274441 [Daphnia pulex]|eukprot:EFX61190.1 hypothetical protein DAPPUDRAFT_274441 [Daphnia pulex]
MKKHKEVFNFKCVKCVGGIIVSAEPQQPVKRGRGRPVIIAMDNRLILLVIRKNPLAAPAARAAPNPPRPTFLAVPAAPGQFGTFSPMDIGSPAVFPVEVSPIDSLPLLAQALPEIRVEARVAGIE